MCPNDDATVLAARARDALNLAATEPDAALPLLRAIQLPDTQEFRSLAAAVSYNLGVLLRDSHDLASAEATWDETADRFSTDPDPEVAFWAALALFNHAALLLDLSPERTVDDANAALELLERLVTDFATATHPEIRQRASLAAGYLVQTLLDLGRVDEAARRYGELRPAWSGDDPGSETWDVLAAGLQEAAAGPFPEDVLEHALRLSSPDLLAALAQIEAAPVDSNERFGIAFATPALLTDRANAVLVDPDAPREAAAFVAQLREALFQQRFDYQLLGRSRTEQVLDAVPAQISETAARSLLERSDAVVELSAPFVEALGQRSAALADAGEWREAVRATRLLLAATKRLPIGNPDLPARVSAVNWHLNMSRSALIQVPDVRVLRSATEAGEAILAELPENGPGVAMRAAILMRLAELHCIPYLVGRNPNMYFAALRRWFDRLREEIADPTVDLTAPEWQMPDVRDAFQTAAAYLEAALALPSADPIVRGQLLADRVMIYKGRSLLGDPLDAEVVRTDAHEALSLLDPLRAPTLFASMLAHYRAAGGTAGLEQLDWLTSSPIDELISTAGPRPVVEVLLVVPTLCDADPAALDRGVALFEAARSAIHAVDEALRINAFRAEWELRSLPRRWPSDEEIGGRQPAAARKWLDEKATARGWSTSDVDRIVVRTIIAELTDDPQTDPDESLLRRLEDATYRLAGTHQQLGSFIVGSGISDVATAQRQRGAFAVAAHLGLLAGCAWAPVDADAATEALSIVEHDLGQLEDVNVVRTLLPHLLENAVELEGRMGAAGRRSLQRIHADLISRLLAAGGQDIEALLAAMQLAKGVRTAAAAQSLGILQPDDEDRARLSRIAEYDALTRSSGQGAYWAPSPTRRASIDHLALVTEFEQDLELTSERSDAEAIRDNLERAFDDHVMSVQAGERHETPAPIFADELKQRLAEDEALLLLYAGAQLDGQEVVLELLATRTQFRLVPQSLPGSGEVTIVEAEHVRRRLHVLQMATYHVRHEMLAEPGPLPLTAVARTTADNLLRDLFGPLQDQLRDLHGSGTRRLTIVAHGALHFLPFHVLHVDGVPIAELFDVSYLPNIALLRGAAGAGEAPVRSGETVSVGLSFSAGGDDGLPPIPEAVTEAEKVAVTTRSTPLLDAQATPTAVRNALARARRVHIATHGVHDVGAPSFQWILLAPDADASARLHAWELLQLDLRGLELITLSACETALGRFDDADNVRGFAANALIQGAAAVVGTMWPVESGVSRDFFVKLYEGLSAGTPRLEAFATAQRAVRRQYPQYRDWGAFMYMGR